MDCLFCKIIRGDIPSSTIYEDDIVKVILDIYPHANGHMLIVPKKHYLDINDIDNDVLVHIYKVVAPKMYKLIEEKLGALGFNLDQNNGIAQDIKHYHVHLVPRYKGKYELLDVKEIYEKLIG